ncbi:hypothetical protein [Streptomyces sp. WP-1]|uniref:hypothetical protein n=1 Tax=Streptomyces sp. WP-1 TaxID=3041497 RepID=UPI0026496C36|nr:hypothetical protein [Streptomyces sp. WP-1]WKE67800.1 hypothetical protein QHG49_01500 [Streptomyces sp. WP-1]
MAAEPFRTDPPPERLKAGDVCRVGVPPTVIHVTAVDRHDPPLETGWPPRPAPTVSVLPRGLSRREFPDGSHLDGTGYGLHPGDGTPFTFELLMRPYAFLSPGDEVADAAGRAWRIRRALELDGVQRSGPRLRPRPRPRVAARLRSFVGRPGSNTSTMGESPPAGTPCALVRWQCANW